ncbi:MAG: cupin domain-containing protein, partial [Rhodospirillaceae bacterium]|nr:cupin domain-containing protein [Rhodospirillaceae bacterium]
YRDIGIEAATDGLAGVRVVRAKNRAATKEISHAGEFNFLFVLQGEITLRHSQFGQHQLAAGDSCVLPAGAPYALNAEAGLEMLEVTLPARLPKA